MSKPRVRNPPNQLAPGVLAGLPKTDVVVRQRYQRGFDRTTEPRDTPFAYTGTSVNGWRVMRAGRNVGYTYQPTPSDGPYANLRVGALGYLGTRERSVAINKSWSRLMESIKGDTSELGTTAAEGREAFEMVGKRAMGLFRAYRYLRGGNFRRALNELSVDPKRKHRSKTRNAAHEASALWLEYWFGWSPTVNDMHNTALVLASEPILAQVRATGSSRVSLPPATTVVDSGGDYRRVCTESGFVLMKQGCTVEVENPNLFLGNRLGLINPASIAWELVPFSFVVDWFVKFGDCLSGFTDLAGLRVTKPYSTMFVKTRCEGIYGRQTPTTIPAHIAWPSCIGQHRQTSLLRPVPLIPKISYFGTSTTRAATAVSLLTQLMLKS